MWYLISIIKVGYVIFGRNKEFMSSSMNVLDWMRNSLIEKSSNLEVVIRYLGLGPLHTGSQAL